MEVRIVGFIETGFENETGIGTSDPNAGWNFLFMRDPRFARSAAWQT